ncbi:hypothetical protein [Dyella nitratireducens]|uniref:Uncharacterized protein n=1 Tax=Dyella nitratireducens TaxID=1849580 RepID=A0ABQ1GIY0_9GAMM|nr:hypothetical protein [Dyella nitratireducens]GGA44775.1 hypothetical protein GCM10010981_37290 [Dyella nitratireducens]GLQ41231.1 hypothetical protein GCM10007902_10810 [Dyella nitratireducens]
MSAIELPTSNTEFHSSPLETFVACAHQLLDPATPESVRKRVEPALVAQLPVLRALGMFDLFEVRDPAMRAWLGNELLKLKTWDSRMASV